MDKIKLFSEKYKTIGVENYVKTTERKERNQEKRCKNSPEHFICLQVIPGMPFSNKIIDIPPIPFPPILFSIYNDHFILLIHLFLWNNFQFFVNKNALQLR